MLRSIKHWLAWFFVRLGIRLNLGREYKDGVRDYNDLYWVLAAIRGPDDVTATSQRLKDMITRRIRAILRLPPVLKLDVLPLDLDLLPFIVARVRRESGSHFLEHLREGVLATVTHPVWEGKGQAIVTALGGSIIA